jgi:hypothetical protein
MMKGGSFANGTVNEIAIRRVAKGKHVCFDGSKQLGGGIGELAKNRLAADDHKLVGPSDARGGADDMLKLVSLHGGCERAI